MKILWSALLHRATVINVRHIDNGHNLFIERPHNELDSMR